MILVTGCNGLLGSHIAHSLVENGHAVRGYVRKDSNLSLIHSSVRSKIDWVTGSLFDSYQLGKAMEGVDTIIHTAAVVSYSPSRIKEMYRTNVQGTANLVNEAAEAGVKEFIHVSSVAALGRPVGKVKIDETDLWVESDQNSHYAKSKYLAELEVFRAFEEGLGGFVLNPSLILSAGDLAKSSARLFGYVLKGGKYSSEGSFNYIDVRDVSNILLQLMLKGQAVSGERFILSAGQVDYNYFFKLVAQSFGVDPPSKIAGSFLKEVLWRVEHVRSLMTGVEPLITKETARLTEVANKFDPSKIKLLLDYQFYTVEESVDWVCQELLKRPSVYNLLPRQA